MLFLLPAGPKDSSKILTRRLLSELEKWRFIFLPQQNIYDRDLECFGWLRAADLTPDRSSALNLPSPNAGSLNLPTMVLMGWEAQTAFLDF